MAEIILPPEEETPQVPELNIDKPTENSKVITIEFEAKKTNKVSTKDTNQQLYTTDTDAWFEFKETSLESANGTYSVVFRNRHDGSIFQRTGDVVNGVAYYKIPHQEIRHAGAWRGQVVYTLGNGDTTAREFDYDVKGHILDGKDVREIVVEDFETLMSQLRNMKDNAEVELANLTQELENTNDTAEQNETDRQAFFDDLVEDIDDLQANYQELLDTGVLQTNINTKLEQLEEEYAPKLTEVTAQLAQTIRLDESNLSLSNFKESDRAVIQGLEPGQINAVLGYKNVKPENTNFFKTGKNLFNKTAIQVGKSVSVSDGVIFNHVSYSVSEYIVITPESNYAFTEISNVAWYDSNRNFISGVSTPNVLLSPKEALYMMATISNNFIDVAQIEKGDTKTPYEDFKQFIGKENTEKHLTEKEDLPSIELNMTEFYATGKNLFDKNSVFENKGIHVETGDLVDITNSITSYFIKIKPNIDYSFSRIDHVAWYDKNKGLINSTGYPETVKSPSNAEYARVAVTIYTVDIAQMEEGLRQTPYEPYREFIDEKYLPENSKSQLVNFDDDYEARKVIAEKNALEFIPNSKEPLDIPTYVPEGVTGQRDVTHPNVLHFKNGWNGYKFWMAFTPYPMAQNQYENPSIVASNDNINWVEPTQNPIAPLESGYTFQSDPEILMRGNTMELWYRATLNTAGELDTTFYRMTSTDGINWTPREAMFRNNNKVDGEIVSPAIIFEDGIYKMWFTRRGLTNEYTMEYGESVDGKTWDVRVLDIKFNFKDYYFWHGDVYKHKDGKIDMVIGCKSNTQPWAMFYTYSYDNVNFVPPMLLVRPTLGTTFWDNQDLYKPSIVMVDDEIYLYYSTPYRIGLTTGKNFYELGLHNKVELEELYPVKHLRSKMNAYSVDDTFDVFPENSIVYTKVWSVEDRGWPALSGLIITQNVWKEANDTRQFFYPSGQDYYLIRTAKYSGWSAWKTIKENV